MTILLAGLLIFISNATEAVIGFGATLIAIPFITLLLGMKTGVVALTTVSYTLAIYTVISKRKKINYKEYFTILPIMLLMLPIGMQIIRSLDAAYLKKFLGLFLVVVSTIQIITFFKKDEEVEIKRPSLLIKLLLLIPGGIIQGAFSSGGPFVVLYAKKCIKDKTEFRATLSLLWVSLNTLILGRYALEGSYTHEVITTYFSLIPFMLLGIVVGEYLHFKISQRAFSLVVYIGLFITGLFLLFSV